MLDTSHLSSSMNRRHPDSVGSAYNLNASNLKFFGARSIVHHSSQQGSGLSSRGGFATKSRGLPKPGILIKGDWYSQNLKDPGVIKQTRAAMSDQSISRTEMMTIMRDAEDYNVISNYELNDLRTVISRLPMPDYVRVLSNKIVNEDPANASIGNLSAGSTGGQMEKLVGKWFLGTDYPLLADPNGISYQKVNGSLFQNGISVSDIHQGGLGDCFLMASLGAAALKTPDAIRNMITDNGDGTFTVRFFGYKSPGDPVSTNKLDYVTVDRQLPTDSNGRLVYANAGSDRSNSNNELWTNLIEKAYAQLHGGKGYGQLNQGGSGYWTLRHITGKPTESHSTNTASGLADMLSAFNAGQLVTLPTNMHGGAHELTLTGYDSASDQYTVYDPWGNPLSYTGSGDFSSTFPNYTKTI